MSRLPAVLGEGHDVAQDGNRRTPPHQYVYLFWTGHIEVSPRVGVGSQQVELLDCVQIAHAIAHSVLGERELIAQGCRTHDDISESAACLRITVREDSKVLDKS